MPRPASPTAEPRTFAAWQYPPDDLTQLPSGALVLGATIVVIFSGIIGVLAWRRRPRSSAPAAPQRPAVARPTPAYGGRAISAPDVVRAPAADGSLPERSVEQEAVERFLAEVRGALGGDDVVLWTQREGEDPVPSASANGGAIAIFETNPSIESLLHWAMQQGMPASNFDTEDAFLLAAPVGRPERIHGAITVYAADRRQVSRERVKAFLPRYAARLGLLLDMLHDGRETRRYRGKAELLAKAAERIHGSKNLTGLGWAICDAALEISGGTRAAFVLWDEEEGRGQVVGVSPGHPVPHGFKVSDSSFVGTACRERQRFMIRESYRRSDFPLFGADEPARRVNSIAIVPLQHEDRSLGAMAVEGDEESQLTTVEGSLLLLLASVASVTLQTVRRLEEVTAKSLTDSLTQLPNRRLFDDRMRQHVAECDRHGQVLSLVLADIDHFKKINDTHGHAAGDAVLAAISQVVARGVRNIDLCARYGGEELAILLPQTPLEAARDVAERLRRSVEALKVKLPGDVSVSVTISLGVASYPFNSRNRESFFAAADRALYAAKSAGRNCVRVSDLSTANCAV